MVIETPKLEASSLDYIIRVDDLSVRFDTYEGQVHALSNVKFDLKVGEILGIIGESGSGKSTLALSLMSLLPDNATVSGEVRFRSPTGTEDEVVVTSAVSSGRAYFKMKKRAKRILDTRLINLRWRSISMVFQGAMNSLNPVYTVRRQLKEVFDIHEPTLPISEVTNRIEIASKYAGFNTRFLDSYPHQLSGGMKQRAVIAMALALGPELIIADEPTTGLDVITQAKIIKELKQLRDSGLIRSMIIISHDVGVVAQLADKVAVLYAGRIMELGSASEVFVSSSNPYTVALMDSYPSIRSTKKVVNGIPGAVPDLLHLPGGCYFAPRCSFAKSDCSTETPSYQSTSPGHLSLCLYAKQFVQQEENVHAPDEGAVQEKKMGATVSNYHLIESEQLTKYFDISSSASAKIFGIGKKRFVRAVDHIDITIKKGQILGIVGESGSGKTTFGRTLLMTIKPTSGDLFYNYEYNGELVRKKISKLVEKDPLYRAYRKQTQLIFQDPYDSLNPKMSILDSISEPVVSGRNVLTFTQLEDRKHNVSHDHKDGFAKNLFGGDAIDVVQTASEALETANLRPPSNYLNRYPHELSGGERQRVSIARSLAVRPEFLVADEPISMLDVSIRANIMNLLLKLRSDFGMTIVYISHDIASTRYVSDQMLVMYLGVAVEYGPVEDIIGEPYHPYSKALVAAVPSPDPAWINSDLKIIGEIGNSVDVHPGCRFYDRCVYRKDICESEPPPVRKMNNRQYVCHFDQGDLIENPPEEVQKEEEDIEALPPVNAKDKSEEEEWSHIER